MHGRREHHPNAKYHPRAWPTWLIVALAWIISRLPFTWIRAIGNATGALLYRLGAGRRHITETNIAKCFPELDTLEQKQMVQRVFKNISLGAIELMIPWLNPRRDLLDRFTVVGSEHLDEAVQQGAGVILVGGHYSVMDVTSPILSTLGPLDVMYRFNKNPVWEWLQVSGRQRYFDGVIEREDTRQTLRRIKQGRIIWYAADQDYGRKHSVFAPFFGIETATIVATSRFARLNNSPVLLLRQERDPDEMRWTLTFSPIIENFPSTGETQSDEADAIRLNKLLEEQIRIIPDQYLWLHKRFKTRPENEASFY